MSEPPEPIGPHDLGGLPGGEIDRASRDPTFWERRVDAMVYLLFNKGFIKDWAQIRHRIELLGPDAYSRLSYYERWAAAAADLMVDAGVVSRSELEARVEELRRDAG